jgi:hypothetical protein
MLSGRFSDAFDIYKIGMRHPAEPGAAEVERFLNWLATEHQAAVSTHKQRLSHRSSNCLTTRRPIALLARQFKSGSETFVWSGIDSGLTGAR